MNMTSTTHVFSPSKLIGILQLVCEADSHSNRPRHDPHQRIPATHFARDQERPLGPLAEDAGHLHLPMLSFLHCPRF